VLQAADQISAFIRLRQYSRERLKSSFLARSLLFI
jgi:hypothetical protein